jgi:hypothetical protein
LTERDFAEFKRVVEGYVTLSRSYMPQATAKAAE